MKGVIKEVSVEVVAWHHPSYSFTDKPTWSVTGKSELGIIRIIDQEGLEGNAFCGSFAFDQESFDAPIRAAFPIIRAALVGSSAFDREPLWTKIWDRVRRRDLSVRWVNVIDVAMWDLAGKAAGLPIYKMLGACRHKVLAYASSPFYSEVGEYMEEALKYKGRGFKAYKIHPGGRRPAEVVRLCQQVRKAVGDDMHLLLDSGTDPWDFREALEVGLALDDLKFHWYEDPLSFAELDNLAELARKLKTPLAVHDFADPRQFPMVNYILKGAGKFIRTDSIKDGITGMKKLAAVCEAHGVKLEPHHGSNSLGNAANLQVIFSIDNCDFFEHIVPEEWHQFGLVEDITVDSEGYVHASEKPGLGFEVDWGLIRSLKPRVIK